MAPKKQFSREQIVNAAFEIAKTHGISGLTVRQVAEELGSSVAPIYVNFRDIAELKQAVVQRVFAEARRMLEVAHTGNPALDVGIASIRFAREYSVLFRELVLTKNEYMAGYEEGTGDDAMAQVASDPSLEGFTAEEIQLLFLKVRIFQLGLSAMVANELVPPDFTEADEIELLESAGQDFLAGTRWRKQGEPG